MSEETRESSSRRPEQRCAGHPDDPTVVACEACGRWVCVKCRRMTRGETRCNACPSPTYRWRAPLLLRLSILAAGASFALAALYRGLDPLLTFAGRPSRSAAVLQLGPTTRYLSWLPSLRWEHLHDLAHDSWGPAAWAAVIASCVAFGYLRDESEERPAIVRRAVLVVLLSFASFFLRADEVWRLILR